MMKRFAVILILAFVLVSCSQNEISRTSLPLSEGYPEDYGMSTGRLARIDSMCLKAISENEAPGMVALVARKGKIVYYKAFGMADNQTGRQLKRDDIFRIASQTKAITSTAVMMLWEEGKFRLDDPISKYIPEFKNPQLMESFNYKDSSFITMPAIGEITIRQLINHTSGLGYGAIDADERFRMIYHKAEIIDAFTTENVTIEENIKKLAKLPLHHNPGEKYTYCEGLDVLGYFIEIISGMPFDVFLRTRLFDPLGMDDTWFYLPDDKASRLVSVQENKSGDWKKIGWEFYDPEYPVKGAKAFFSGGGGLSSTAKDYATFLQMYLNGGELNGKRILSRTTVKTIMSNQNNIIWGDDADAYYALAFSVLTKKGEAKGGEGTTGTFSWGGYFSTHYFADPEEQTIGILMKQTRGVRSDNTSWKFKILVGQAIDD
jgi:CubicO group peptidase (beta-lactamase class C family)